MDNQAGKTEKKTRKKTGSILLKEVHYLKKTDSVEHYPGRFQSILCSTENTYIFFLETYKGNPKSGLILCIVGLACLPTVDSKNWSSPLGIHPVID